MDLPQLCGVLQGCLSTNQQERTQAEQLLKQVGGWARRPCCAACSRRLRPRGPTRCALPPVLPPPRRHQPAMFIFSLLYFSPSSHGMQHEGSRGQIVNLLRVAAEPSAALDLRQVAAITFKNICRKNWEPKEGVYFFIEAQQGGWMPHSACNAWPLLPAYERLSKPYSPAAQHACTLIYFQHALATLTHD